MVRLSYIDVSSHIALWCRPDDIDGAIDGTEKLLFSHYHYW